jgi:hypothetical protein
MSFAVQHMAPARLNIAIQWRADPALINATFMEKLPGACNNILAIYVTRPRDRKFFVRFQVLTAVGMKLAIFWVVAPCSLVEVYRRLRGAYCLHYQGDRPDDEGSKHL